MIEVRDVSFSYGSREILSHFSLNVRSGECVVLAGSNGRGKSTALSLIAGVLRPDSGKIRISGKVAYIPQGAALLEDMTVAENLRFFASLTKLGTSEKLPFNLTPYMNTKVAKLSGGLKKQLSIACALLVKPDIILLDEPCAGLDIIYRNELIDIIHSLKSRGCALVYVGHEPMEFISFCDCVVFLGEQTITHTKEELAGTDGDTIRFCEEFSTVFARTAT